jgi:hypothetical protein
MKNVSPWVYRDVGASASFLPTFKVEPASTGFGKGLKVVPPSTLHRVGPVSIPLATGELGA